MPPYVLYDVHYIDPVSLAQGSATAIPMTLFKDPAAGGGRLGCTSPDPTTCKEGYFLIDTGKRCFAPPCKGAFVCVPACKVHTDCRTCLQAKGPTGKVDPASGTYRSQPCVRAAGQCMESCDIIADVACWAADQVW